MSTMSSQLFAADQMIDYDPFVTNQIGHPQEDALHTAADPSDVIDGITVTGHRTGNQFAFAYENHGNTGITWTSSAFSGGSSPPAPGDGPEIAVTVNVKVSDPAQHDAAVAAAEHYAKVLVELENALDSMDPNTKIMFNNQSMTVAQIENEISRTEFVITDNPQYGNGGFGTAQYSSTGPNVDTVYYGILADSNPLGGSTYGSPNYTHDEGLFGILAHEIGHMTAAGQSDQTQEVGYYNQDTHKTGSYLSSAYFTNGENFAWDFSRALLQSAGVGAGAGDAFFNQLGATPWTQPIILFHERNPGVPIRPIG